MSGDAKHPSESPRAHASQRAAQGAGSRRRLPWLPIFLVTALFCGAYAALEGSREIGRWHLASAAESWTEAEYARALGNESRAAEYQARAFASLEKALSWNPDEVAWIAQGAEWKQAAGKLEEALADCDKAQQLGGDQIPILRLRSQVLHQLGKDGEAVKDVERIDQLSKTSGIVSRAEALNELAYIKALGKIDLDGALAAVEEALKVHPGELAFLDTRGFIYLQKGEYNKALPDLNLAVQGYEKLLADWTSDLDASRKSAVDVRHVDLEGMHRKKIAAVIIYHRALVHEKLGNSSAAAADRKRVKELIGREGDDSLF